ncbi:MAG: folate-binding protein [Sphingomonadales bacterium]
MPSAHLASRGVLALDGADARDFLQGLVTNDTSALTPDTPLYAAMLTPQGKYLFDLLAVDAGNTIYLDCEGARIDDLMRRLTMYKLRARVDIRNVSDDRGVIAVWDSEPDHAPDCITARDPRHPDLGWRMICPRATMTGLEAEDTYDAHRLALGIPAPGDFEVDKTLILEGNVAELHGVSFSKGCYVGQELTARMNHRGKVRKRLIPVKVNGSLPEPGTPVLKDGKTVGDIRTGQGPRAIAFLRIEDVAHGDRLECGDSHLTVDIPGWLAPKMVLPA